MKPQLNHSQANGSRSNSRSVLARLLRALLSLLVKGGGSGSVCL
jgi:hypothetical protein